MNTIAYFTSSSDINNVPPSFFSRFFPRLSNLKNDFSLRQFNINGSLKISGFFIVLPKLSYFTIGRETLIMDKVVSAASAAGKKGAKIFGLGGFLSQACDRNYTLFNGLGLPVTGGSALASWTVFEGIYRIARKNKADMKSLTLAVIGPYHSVGSLSARKLSAYVSKTIINSRDENKALLLKESISHLSHSEVIIEKDPIAALRKADIIVFCDPAPAFDYFDIKKGVIVCDATIDGSIEKTLGKRDDLDFFRAGLIKIPEGSVIKPDNFFARGVIPAALAETILLALENKLVSYSIGENVNLDKMEEIADMAAKHLFQVWLPQAPVL